MQLAFKVLFFLFQKKGCFCANFLVSIAYVCYLLGFLYMLILIYTVCMYIYISEIINWWPTEPLAMSTPAQDWIPIIKSNELNLNNLLILNYFLLIE